jgi:hypothetical protein
MKALESQDLRIDKLEELLSAYKMDILENMPFMQFTSQLICAYLQELVKKLFNDRQGRYKVLDAIDLRFKVENSESLDPFVHIKTRNLDLVCDTYGITPQEIDQIIDEKVQKVFNSYVYKIEENEEQSNAEFLFITIYKGGDMETLVGDHTQNAWEELVSLEIRRPSFNKAIAIYDEFKKRFVNGRLIDKEFIDNIAQFIKNKENTLNYELFNTFFANNIVLAYEFIAFFVDICYTRDLKKKQ